jgi:hypothetical protein
MTMAFRTVVAWKCKGWSSPGSETILQVEDQPAIREVMSAPNSRALPGCRRTDSGSGVITAIPRSQPAESGAPLRAGTKGSPSMLGAAPGGGIGERSLERCQPVATWRRQPREQQQMCLSGRE